MIYINKVSVVSVKVSVIEEAPMALPFLPSSVAFGNTKILY